MKPKVRFRGNMVAITTDTVIALFTRAEFVAALQAEQRRRRRAHAGAVVRSRGADGT